ncbi:hypothetical protein [Leuconostoc gelidum]|nr:hypothetical protein [Leuconostoc gelidum]
MIIWSGTATLTEVGDVLVVSFVDTELLNPARLLSGWLCTSN